MPPLSPNKKLAFRKAITDYCLRAEASQVHWNYSRQRPFGGYGKQPEDRHVNDCSGYVSLIFYWAMNAVGVDVIDPLGEGYSGYGNTGSQYEWLTEPCHPGPEGQVPRRGHGDLRLDVQHRPHFDLPQARDSQDSDLLLERERASASTDRAHLPP